MSAKDPSKHSGSAGSATPASASKHSVGEHTRALTVCTNRFCRSASCLLPQRIPSPRAV